MSPAATRDIRAAGLASRHAAALSGNGIRAGARIAAGAMPGYSQLGKGTIHGPSLDCSDASLARFAGPPCRGLRASAFPFPLCGGPSSLGTRREAVGATPPGAGRQPFNDALRPNVEPLKPTHSRLQICSRRPTSARTGLRDLRNVTAPRRHQQDDAGAFECRSRNF